jgi:hypothetical protein
VSSCSKVFDFVTPLDARVFISVVCDIADAQDAPRPVPLSMNLCDETQTSRSELPKLSSIGFTDFSGFFHTAFFLSE